MSATAYEPALREAPPARVTRVSWGAILAGALVAFVVVAMLHVLGLAAGLTAVDAVDRDTPDAGTFAMGAAAWSVASHLIGLAAGGYVAARLSGGVEAALHGLGVWATATVVSALMIGNLAAGAANTAGSALSSVLGGLGRGAGQAVSAAAEQLDPEQLVERARLALTAPAEPARMTTEQRAAEITSIIGQRVAEGRFAEGRRERLNALVAAEAGLPPEEAARRVAAYEAE
ncbi:MAG: hypothetical protein K2X11_15860, partial [Acetobacteraceae bacterium]|nr:hypothetical protein [Acetobacteraceae bacterium]